MNSKTQKFYNFFLHTPMMVYNFLIQILATDEREKMGDADGLLLFNF